MKKEAQYWKDSRNIIQRICFYLENGQWNWGCLYTDGAKSVLEVSIKSGDRSIAKIAFSGKSAEIYQYRIPGMPSKSGTIELQDLLLDILFSVQKEEV